MARLMSVTLTEDAVVRRIKTATRRLGWTYLKPGDELALCRKVMGRRRGDGTVEPLVRLARVRVVDVRREVINAITDEDVALEGLTFEDLREFDDWAYWCDHDSPTGECCGIGTGRLGTAFMHFFCHHMKVSSGTEITRIGWTYLDDEQEAA